MSIELFRTDETENEECVSKFPETVFLTLTDSLGNKRDIEVLATANLEESNCTYFLFSDGSTNSLGIEKMIGAKYSPILPNKIIPLETEDEIEFINELYSAIIEQMLTELFEEYPEMRDEMQKNLSPNMESLQEDLLTQLDATYAYQPR